MAHPLAPGGAKSFPPPPNTAQHNQNQAQSPKEFAEQYRKAIEAPTSPPKRVPEIDRTQIDPQVLQAAQKMESMFLNEVMKVMRQSIPKSDLSMDSNAIQIYQSMRDQEFADKASKGEGFGMAEQIIQYLEQSGYNVRNR